MFIHRALIQCGMQAGNVHYGKAVQALIVRPEISTLTRFIIKLDHALYTAMNGRRGLSKMLKEQYSHGRWKTLL